MPPLRRPCRRAAESAFAVFPHERPELPTPLIAIVVMPPVADAATTLDACLSSPLFALRCYRQLRHATLSRIRLFR